MKFPSGLQVDMMFSSLNLMETANERLHPLDDRNASAVSWTSHS